MTRPSPRAPRATGSDSDRESSRTAPSPLRRAVYVVVGLVLVGLAGLGVVLPVLPTTPLVLLASYFFARSSPRLQRWLLRSRVFGPVLRDWAEHRGVRASVKVKAVGMIVVVVGLTVAFGSLGNLARVGVVSLAAVGVGVVLSLDTVPPDEDREAPG